MKSKLQKVIFKDFVPSLLCVFALTLFLLSNVSAASLTNYKERIEHARLANEELLESLEQNNKEIEQEIIAEITAKIPPTETVEWPGGSIETQNGWLAAKIKEFTDRRDDKMRRQSLIEISERLLAIEESVENLEKAVSGARSKDEDKQKLAEILRREEYQKPEEKAESLFQRWWREFQEWLARKFPEPNLEPGTPSGLGDLQFGLQILIFAAVLALVGFLLYRFAPFLSGRFARRTKTKKEDRIILGERIGADESASDLFNEAEQLAREGNLRSAIRKGYIAVLCDLSDRKIVRLARHKTNRDYLRDVRKNESLFENMSGLTYNFETNWYGLRTAEEADWEDFRERYKQTIANARRQG